MRTNKTPFHCLAFDLDDTLVDTWQVLIPHAARCVCEAMVSAGLNTTVESCTRERGDFLLKHRGENSYLHLATTFGNRAGKSDEQIAEIGYAAYHAYQVPPDLQLIDGVREMLEELRTRYHLHLVTSGRPETQRQKIAILKLEPLMQKIWIVNPYTNEYKKTAFAHILSEEKCQPQQLLSIGNRLDHEIREAKELLCRTCYIPYGEFAHLQPQGPAEIPDYTLKHITELVQVCQL